MNENKKIESDLKDLNNNGNNNNEEEIFIPKSKSKEDINDNFVNSSTICKFFLNLSATTATRQTIRTCGAQHAIRYFESNHDCLNHYSFDF